MTQSRYDSRYSPDRKVTAAQYIIELICEKKAKTEGKDLPIKFWNLPEWEKFFKMQLRKCHSLLKQYHEKAIIRALMDFGAVRIYSLHAPWLIPIIEKYQKIVLLEIAKIDKSTISPLSSCSTTPLIRKPQDIKTTLSKLKDLD